MKLRTRIKLFTVDEIGADYVRLRDGQGNMQKLSEGSSVIIKHAIDVEPSEYDIEIARELINQGYWVASL
jgi:hypothetical protein